MVYGLFEQSELAVPNVEVEQCRGSASAGGFGVVALIFGKEVAAGVDSQRDFAAIHSPAPKLVFFALRVPFLLDGVVGEVADWLLKGGALVADGLAGCRGA